MSEFSPLDIRRIRQLPVITVASRADEPQMRMDLLHPDSYIIGSQVTLRELMSDYEMRVQFLGRRLANMNFGGSFLPLGLEYSHGVENVRVIGANDKTDVHIVNPLNSEAPRFQSRKLRFATVDIAQLPPTGASHFVSTVVEKDGAFLVAVKRPLTVKVMPSLKPEVTIAPFTAAIVPPGSPIFMQGAQSMLFRPV
jgi:hypothetical protein